MQAIAVVAIERGYMPQVLGARVAWQLTVPAALMLGSACGVDRAASVASDASVAADPDSALEWDSARGPGSGHPNGSGSDASGGMDHDGGLGIDIADATFDTSGEVDSGAGAHVSDAAASDSEPGNTPTDAGRDSERIPDVGHHHSACSSIPVSAPAPTVAAVTFAEGVFTARATVPFPICEGMSWFIRSESSSSTAPSLEFGGHPETLAQNEYGFAGFDEDLETVSVETTQRALQLPDNVTLSYTEPVWPRDFPVGQTRDGTRFALIDIAPSTEPTIIGAGPNALHFEACDTCATRQAVVVQGPRRAEPTGSLLFESTDAAVFAVEPRGDEAMVFALSVSPFTFEGLALSEDTIFAFRVNSAGRILDPFRIVSMTGPNFPARLLATVHPSGNVSLAMSFGSSAVRGDSGSLHFEGVPEAESVYGTTNRLVHVSGTGEFLFVARPQRHVHTVVEDTDGGLITGYWGSITKFGADGSLVRTREIGDVRDGTVGVLVPRTTGGAWAFGSSYGPLQIEGEAEPRIDGNLWVGNLFVLGFNRQLELESVTHIGSNGNRMGDFHVFAASRGPTGDVYVTGDSPHIPAENSQIGGVRIPRRSHFMIRLHMPDGSAI